MEINKVEITAVADVAAKTNDGHIVELADLQLALIGGGSGEVVLA